MAATEWHDHTLQVEVLQIEQDMKVVQVKTVTPDDGDIVIPEAPNNNSTPVQDDKKTLRMITLDGRTYNLVLSPVAPKDP